MTWRAFSEFDLRHLTPFTLKVTPKSAGAPTLKVLVSFGSHTFTREWRASDPAHLRFVDGSEVRCFCQLRYGLSVRLPEIIVKASSGKAFFSPNRNYLLIEGVPGLAGPYAVFFNIEKSTKADADVSVFVVSAYEKPNLPPKSRIPSISFATLVAKTARGEIVTRPKK